MDVFETMKVVEVYLEQLAVALACDQFELNAVAAAD
jgi:hypothetical protein